jgi:glycosyltransferase involved in cell wall biosynthesis
MSEMTSNDEIEPCLTAVMPVYNEAATVAEVVRVVLAQRPVQELVIVDDYSTDGTWELLQLSATNEPRIKLLRHDINQGKGAALRTGISRATSKIIVIQDADLEYDPGEYCLLLAPILSGKADVVFGSRFLRKLRSSPCPLFLALGRKQFPHHVLEHGHGLKPHRHGDGYKAFRRE